jgi:serine/threonine protein phosphatase PrpC
MKIRGAARTDPGRVRRENQDNFGLATNLGLGFVADGMGGHAGGKRASEEAARVITESLAASTADGMEAGLRLRTAIEEANRRVWALPQSEPALHGLDDGRGAPGRRRGRPRRPRRRLARLLHPQRTIEVLTHDHCT